MGKGHLTGDGSGYNCETPPLTQFTASTLKSPPINTKGLRSAPVADSGAAQNEGDSLWRHLSLPTELPSFKGRLNIFLHYSQSRRDWRERECSFYSLIT